MGIIGEDNKTYIFLTGLSVSKELDLGNGIYLQPAQCDPIPDDFIKTANSEIDMGVALIFLRQTSCQLYITADNPKNLAIKAWNAQWDIIFISAVINKFIGFNLQSDISAKCFNSDSHLNITNYNLTGIQTLEPYSLTDEQELFILSNIESGRKLMDNSDFQNAVHALYSYHWHSHPRAQLAILWSGIEGLFNISNEIVFRLSLYCAMFLNPDDKEVRNKTFSNVKSLYKMRSKAVHGSIMKGDTAIAVDGSVQLLLDLIHRCIDLNSMPKPEELIP